MKVTGPFEVQQDGESHRRAVIRYRVDDERLALAFKTPMVKTRVWRDTKLIEFAARVVEKMNQPKENFPQPGSGDRSTYYPTGPHGRLDWRDSELSRATVDRRVSELVARGLMTKDPWTLTDKGQHVLRIVR